MRTHRRPYGYVDLVQPIRDGHIADPFGSAGIGLHTRTAAGECAFHSCLTDLIAHLAPTGSELAAPYIALTLAVSCSAGPH